MDLQRRIQDLQTKITAFDSLLAEARRREDWEAVADLEAEQAQVRQTLTQTLMLSLEDLEVDPVTPGAPAPHTLRGDDTMHAPDTPLTLHLDDLHPKDALWHLGSLVKVVAETLSASREARQPLDAYALGGLTTLLDAVKHGVLALDARWEQEAWLPWQLAVRHGAVAEAGEESAIGHHAARCASCQAQQPCHDLWVLQHRALTEDRLRAAGYVLDATGHVRRQAARDAADNA
jgi:hypothetical protein